MTTTTSPKTPGRPATGQRVRLQAVVDLPLHEKLTTEAERRGLGMSTLVREILIEWGRRDDDLP